jgi:hypothetical protein
MEEGEDNEGEEECNKAHPINKTGGMTQQQQ